MKVVAYAALLAVALPVGLARRPDPPDERGCTGRIVIEGEEPVPFRLCLFTGEDA